MSSMHSITDNPFKKKKLRQDVIIKMSDGRQIDGKLFVGYNERILDVLNDGRTFVPIENDEGNLLILSKNAIVSLDTHDVTAFATKVNIAGTSAATAQPLIQQYDGISPYKVLELPEGSDIAKVRKRYLKIRELLNVSVLEEAGIDKVMLSLAKLYLTQIENAYQLIARADMQKSTAEEQNSTGEATDEDDQL